jgi:hypothetical protein
MIMMVSSLVTHSCPLAVTERSSSYCPHHYNDIHDYIDSFDEAKVTTFSSAIPPCLPTYTCDDHNDIVGVGSSINRLRHCLLGLNQC